MQHIGDELGDGERYGDEVRDGEERLLVHLARIGMVAAEVPDRIVHELEELAVDHAGMAVVLDHHEGPVGAGRVKLHAGEQAPLGYRMRRGAEGDEDPRFGAPREIGGHLHDLLIGTRSHDVQPGIEGGEAREVLVGVDEAGRKRAGAQADDGTAGVCGRELVSHEDDAPPILHEIAEDLVLRVDG